MKDPETVKAGGDIIDASWLETNIDLCTDTMEFIIEHSIDDSQDDAREKAYERLEMLYALTELRKDLKELLKRTGDE